MFQFILEIAQMYSLYANLETSFVSYSQYAKMIIAFTLFLAVSIYIFKSIAIFLMSRKNNLKHTFLAFIPFLNFCLLGKLTGTVRFFSLKIKNIGIWLCVLLFASLSINTFLDIYCFYDEFFLLVNQNILTEADQFYYVSNLFVEILIVLSNILDLVVIVFVVWFNISFVSKFARRQSILLSILMTLLFSNQMFYISYNLMLAIVVIVCRNKKPFDLNEFLARQRQMQMQQNMSSGTGYGNQSQPQTTYKEEDPFEEFSQPNKSGSNLEQDVFSDFAPDNDFSKENDKKRNNSEDDDDLF